MPFNPATLLDASHLVSFLGGAAIGAGGTYFADRFTDQRRRQESSRAERKQFAALQAVMPDLFAEMAKDLREDKTKSIREIVIAPSRGVIFRSDKPRFFYFVSECPALENYVDRLLEAGYVYDVRTGNAPIYRMRENFVVLLGRYVK